MKRAVFGNHDANQTNIFPKTYKTLSDLKAFYENSRHPVIGNEKQIVSEKTNKWHDWLTECCDRLRYHPVFKNPPDETAREACEFCREWCGW